MDVGELLSYKPSKEPKRGALDDEEVETEVRRPAKRLAVVPKPIKTHDENKENYQDKEEPVLPELPDAEDNESGVLNETSLKKLLLAFEKKVLKNQELRIKFPDQPGKFMDSELELHDAVVELRVVAAQPDLYPSLVSISAVPSLLGLLSHENTDIAVAVVELLQEMTDVDTLNVSLVVREETP